MPYLCDLFLGFFFCSVLFFISYSYFVHSEGSMWYTEEAIGQFPGSKDSSPAILLSSSFTQ